MKTINHFYPDRFDPSEHDYLELRIHTIFVYNIKNYSVIQLTSSWLNILDFFVCM